MAASVADVIVETLAASGVRRIHGLPGDSLNGLTDALRRSGEIDWQHVRHEEAAAFAASGEAQLTGELAVCAASCGPGNLHLINGLFDAQRSGVPVLALAAHIPREEIGSGYFQETHPQELFRECSVYCEMVSVAEQLPRLLHVAMRAALTQGGVAVLVIPGEIFLAEHEGKDRIRATTAMSHAVLPGEAEVDAAAELLSAGKAVTIFAGAGCAGAHDELVQLAGALKAPVVHTLRSKESVEPDNPFDVGLTGLLGFSSGYRAIEHCDTLLMLGCDFPYRQFLPQDGEVRVVQVDIRGERIGRRLGVDVAVCGSVRETIEALLPRLRPASDGTHLETMTAHYARTRRKLDALASAPKQDGPPPPQLVAATVDRIASDDAVFIPDVGTPVIWAGRYLRMNGRRRMFGSFNHGSMANALPQAMGAQAAAPGRQVVSFSGDGGLAMLLGELITLRQLGLPVKVVVFDNGSLGFVELEMKAAGIVTWGTELENPDLAAVARAIGLHGVRIEKASELEDGIRDAFAHDGPAVIDVLVPREELSMPPHISAGEAKGFALYGLRSVFSGNGRELVELARTNLRQVTAE